MEGRIRTIRIQVKVLDFLSRSQVVNHMTCETLGDLRVADSSCGNEFDSILISETALQDKCAIPLGSSSLCEVSIPSFLADQRNRIVAKL